MIYLKKKTKTLEEIAAEKMKMEIATQLGLDDKVRQYGWGALTTKESGRIGGIISRNKRNDRKK